MDIQQLRAQIAALQDATMDENKNFRTAYDEGKFDALSAVDALLDSLQEEPVSKSLEEAARNYSNNLDNICGSIGEQTRNAFKKGAQWQKVNLWKSADGEELPAIDREVIALTTEGKVVFAHRPKESWHGKNIVTGEVTTYYPKRYGAGQWNAPDIKWWLDIQIPIIEL